MIDKTKGVIPPRNELNSFPEKTAENSKEQKSEFESLLNQSSRQGKKSDKKERSDQALGGTKKNVQDRDQRLADKSEKTKKQDNENETEGVEKKRTKKLVNEEMVLAGMASIESANKTPDAEVTPDYLENTNLELSSLEAKSVATDPLAETATPTAEMTALGLVAPEMNKISDEALAALSESEQVFSLDATGDLGAQLAQSQKTVTSADLQPLANPLDALTLQDVVDPTVELVRQPQPQAQVPAAKETTEAMVQSQVVVQATPEVVTDAVVSELIPDSKVLETLNREQMFQKLETMKKTEELIPKTESKISTDGISAPQALSSAETSTSYQSADQGQDDLKGDHQEAVQLGAPNHQPNHAAKDFSAVAAASINQPADTQAKDEAGLKEILNQAQYLVTKGGGEVTVKMSPDGMGEVQLKMMLDNGKMTLEMNTQDKNVQRMIQDSLSDLKSSLAAHQISVEHVTLNNKISTVQDAQNTQSSQNFTDAHAHQQPQHSHQRDQRQQARQIFEHETMRAIPLAKNEINKASAHRVYQTNKATSLNAVA